MTNSGDWAAILAGGEGRRLQPFTRALTGDDRPKQFCRLLGRDTLLAETRQRVSHNVAPTRTLYVVTRAHAAFYRPELADTRCWQVVEQPSNRGTAAAVAYALARLRSLDADGIVALFPADHYYRDADALQRTVSIAYAVAEAYTDRIVLVGAEADRAETEYGWIEQGESIDRRMTSRGSDVRAVRRFVEKPEPDVAEALFATGCLWNTLIVVGKIQAFEEMMEAAIPGVLEQFATLRSSPADGHEAAVADALYASLAPIDFSRDVLTPSATRLAVVNLPGAGWTDLGHADRVQDVLAQEARQPTHAASHA